MSMDRNADVVVGVDGSSAADAAALWAADETALRPGSSLELLFAFQIPIVGHPEYEYPPEFADAIRAAGNHTLDRVAAEVTERYPDLPLQRILTESDARLALVKQSAQARLTVVGSRGKGRLAEVLLGSVAFHVAAHGHSPVAVVPEAAHRTDGPILVGVDGSKTSDAALGFAFDQAAERGTEVVALLGWDGLGHQPTARRPAISGMAGASSEVNALLADRCAPWIEKFPDVVCRHVVHQGRPAEGLIGYAERAAQQPQLIVVGSRGRGGLSGLILGSTGHTLITHSRWPVVVVRSATTSQGL